MMAYPQKIILATHNPGKLAEFRSLFIKLNLEFVAQNNLGISPPEETGITFLENAITKARNASKLGDLPSIAEDSGLVVPALNGAPGIYSARYAGNDATDEMNNHKLITELRKKAHLPNYRNAYFYCCMVFVENSRDPTPLVATGKWCGNIIDEPRGNNGFGYDPHFVIDRTKSTSAELDVAAKSRMSHRGIATRELIQKLEVATSF